MSDAKKELIGLKVKIAALDLADVLLRPGIPSPEVVAGVRVETNANAIARFPLPLALPSALIAALGVIAAMRGYKVIGIVMVGAGGLGLVASAAAPELHDQISKLRAP